MYLCAGSTSITQHHIHINYQGNTQCQLHCNIFFQAEDGIRDAQESRGLGDVYKRQVLKH